MNLRSLWILGVLAATGAALAPQVSRGAVDVPAEAADEATAVFAEGDAEESTEFAGELLEAAPPAARPYEETPPPAPAARTKAGARVPAISPDPVPGQWGNVESPRFTPTQAPQVDYLLVRPPDKVMQQEYGAGFEQRVGNPDETFHHGPIYCPRIDLDRPDGLAPIGVIGDHTLDAGGEFLISYRYNYTPFNGNLDGTASQSTDSILANFPIAPTKMQTQKHTILMEYGVTDDLTLLALIPFWDINLNQVTADGTGITNANSDPGDLILQALYVLWRGDQQQLHLNLGMQFPLGVQESEKYPPTPTSPDKSYPLRTTSGTYDFMPGATYRGQNDDWTWGVQGIGTIRFGLNNFDYKLGNRFELTGWLSRKLTDNVSLSGRLDGNIWGDIFGADPRLNQQLVPTNRPNLQGGRRLDLLFGTNFYIPGDYLRSQWFSVEGGIPIYQFLQGPQLKTSWTITAGYNLKF